MAEGRCFLLSVSGTTPQMVSEFATPDDAVRGRGLVRWWKTSGATIRCSVATCKTQQCSFSEPMSLAGTTHLNEAVVDSLVPGKAFAFSTWECFFIEAAAVDTSSAKEATGTVLHGCSVVGSFGGSFASARGCCTAFTPDVQRAIFGQNASCRFYERFKYLSCHSNMGRDPLEGPFFD